MKNILLGITGGIAAYKSAIFARRLQDQGFEVRVVMTESAQEFITPLTFQALTGNPVHTQLLNADAEAGMGHIELAKWADLLVIAPASANTIAKLANGIADNLLTTLVLATEAPIVIAPAMNKHMWQNAMTQKNIATLASCGHHIITPSNGNQACGDFGAGRLPEPEQLVEYVCSLTNSFNYIQATKDCLANKHVVITAGPTQEAIDPVRYISNYSTGKMGYALAKAFRDAGAQVTIVSGKVSLTTPVGIKKIQVRSAVDMLEACQNLADTCDIFVATAAVADYRTRTQAPQKIKKSQDAMMLDLVKNPDVVATIAEDYPHIFVLGFAAETQNLEEYAQGKLKNKKLDMIACNDVSRKDIGFGADENAMTVFFANEAIDKKVLEKATKIDIAKKLVNYVAEALLAN